MPRWPPSPSTCKAGVIESPEGKGAVSDASDLALGAAFWRESPLYGYLHAADVVLGRGSRLALVTFKKGQRIIQLDVDHEEIGRNHPNTTGPARATPRPRSRRCSSGSAPAGPAARLAEGRARGAARQGRHHRHAGAADVDLEGAPRGHAGRRHLHRGHDSGRLLLAPVWPVYHPRTYLSSSYSGNLGFEYPLALGAKVAQPDRAVVSVSGDGGFLYNAQEMSTAMSYKINAVHVVFNDNAYGNVARDLDEAWGGHYGSMLHNPDFMKLADAFGVHGIRAKDPLEVGRLVADAVQMDRPVLIEVPVSRMPRPAFWPPRKEPTKYQR
jgi:acetolactate synthase-1/2/3 large subunit